uniref:Uncharacterized protein n=1 Tax=Anopheles melas TaxID=34690 RepID=A0A182U2K2_9DIPT
MLGRSKENQYPCHILDGLRSLRWPSAGLRAEIVVVTPSLPPRGIITRWQTGQVLERTLDCWRDRWWRRQVITERLETVLVRNVLHPNELPVRCGVRILSLSHLRKRRSCLVAMRRTSPFNLLRQDEV